jgi:regulator of sigma E protease
MFVTIVSFLLMFIVLILAHELGHFVTAKLSKVKVEEFGIFLPPKLFSFKIGETVYSFNAIPLGGFNKLSGEEDPTVPGSLAGKSIPIRLLVLSAGSLMNIILPFILLSIAFMIPHLEIAPHVRVLEVAVDSPAAIAGIQPDDIILSVNDEDIPDLDALGKIVDLNLGKEITMTIQHPDSEIDEVTLTPRINPPESEGALGVGITYNTEKKSYPFWLAIPKGAASYWELIVLFKDGIISMIAGTVPVELAGPVGIAQMTGEIVKTGIANLFRFGAIISLNLGIINIFPIPAMDGGRIVFVLLEWVRRGKRISPKTEAKVHAIGFILLMLLFVVISFHDIIRIFSGQSLLP